jgi:hypothetical protein
LRFIIAVLAVMITGSGCSRPKQDPPRLPSSQGAQSNTAAKNEAEPLESGEPKKGLLGRVFNTTSAVPGYGWDGQMSSSNAKSALPAVHARCTEALRGLGFILNNEESKRQDLTARLQGAKPDRTTVLILLEEKTPGVTELKVKVGTTGDRTGSERILDEIAKAGTRPARTAPPAPPRK